MRYILLIIGFLIIWFVTLLGVQNGISVDLKFISWRFTISLPALIYGSTLLGSILVGIFAIPKIFSNHFANTKLQKKIKTLEKIKNDMEQNIRVLKESSESNKNSSGIE